MDLQEKAAEIAKKYESLSMQDKLGIIAQTFGCKSGKIETSLRYGGWHGISDIFIKFNNGTFLGIGCALSPRAETAQVQNEYINAALLRYNPEIVAATKEAALAVLRKPEAEDNMIAAHMGLKPYTLLNVELNDGTDDKRCRYMGRYYVTLAVDGKIRAHMETGLNYAIAHGKVGEVPARNQYFPAGTLKETEVDYVFDNVGFSSTSDLYSLAIPDDVLRRAEKTLAERRGEPCNASFDQAQSNKPSIKAQLAAKPVHGDMPTTKPRDREVR